MQPKYFNLFFLPKEKKRILDDLKEQIKLKRVDRKIIPFLRKFNLKKDVVSQFSCWGHGLRGFKRPEGGALVFFAKGKAHWELWDIAPTGLFEDIEIERPNLFVACGDCGGACKMLRFRWTVRWRTIQSRKKVFEFLLNLGKGKKRGQN